MYNLGKSKQGLFKPAAKKPLKEEKIMEQALWQESQAEMKETLSEETGQEPSTEDMKRVFQDMLRRMREDGVFQEMMDDYLQKKITAQRARAGLPAIAKLS